MSALREILRPLARQNFWMTAAIGLLLAGSVVFIYSACYVGDAQPVRDLYRKQFAWAAVGVLCYAGFAAFDYRRLRALAWWGYLAVVLLLAVVLVIGEKKFGARRWLDVFGFSLQPSELAKLATIVVLASVLSRPGQDMRGFGVLVAALATVTVPWLLIFAEPDLGTAMIFVPTVVAMLYGGGIPLRRLFTLMGLGLLILGWVAGALVVPERLGATPETCQRFRRLVPMTDYQCRRIQVHFAPSKDPLGAGWNKLQSEISVGSGGLTGKGLCKGTQSILGFLPRKVAPTDFIFAVIAEEAGFLGSVSVVFLFGFLLFGGLQAALLSPDKMGRVLCVGIVTMLFGHVFINMAMTVGVMPITGVPLPLLSYGGSFMVVIMSALGMVQSVYVRSRRAVALA